MEMENITGWTDRLDEERVAQSGDFYIHRNYVDDEGQYRCIPNSKPKKNLLMMIIQMIQEVSI